jgi:hypothetical protein
LHRSKQAQRVPKAALPAKAVPAEAVVIVIAIAGVAVAVVPVVAAPEAVREVTVVAIRAAEADAEEGRNDSQS